MPYPYRNARTPEEKAQVKLRTRTLRRARLRLLARTRFAAMANTHATSLTLKVMIVVAIVIATVLPATTLVASAAGYAYFSRDFPSPAKLADRKVSSSTMIYDREGNLLYEMFDPVVGRRMYTRLNDLPSYVIDATLAVEDPNFYENPGFDLRHITRAFIQNLMAGEIASGASTITQQLVRNVLFDTRERYEQSYQRKIKEALLAVEITQWYSKDEILEMYVNEIDYGNLSKGIGAAAWSYFRKQARELTLAEAAFLVGLPQSPNTYNPYVNLPAAKERQGVVLDAMVRNGYITEREAEDAKLAPLEFAPQQIDIVAPHFVMYVREQLVQKYGEERVRAGGLRVYTTLDPRLQALAEDAAREHIATIKDLDANNAALVAIDPRTGEVLAMLGSVDYWDDSIDGQVNVAISDRQPGSTLKPFTYATAFERLGWSPSTIIIDQPTDFPGGQGMPPYRPPNHDGRYRGPVTVRSALACSLNMPAVYALNEVGIPAMLDTVHRMGITGLTDPDRVGLSVTLGGGEVNLLDLVFAYQGFANGGRQVGAPVPDDRYEAGMREYEPVSILKVTDEMGNVIEEYTPPEGKQVIAPQISYLITSILSDDEARAPTYGRNSFLDIGRPAAAKTGTTDNYRDGWTVGYTPQLLAGVWVGNTDGKPMKDVYGVSGAGYIWGNFMKRALANEPVASFDTPDGLARATTCKVTGKIATDNCPTKVEDWHIADTLIRETCDLHVDQYFFSPSNPTIPLPPGFDQATPAPEGERDPAQGDAEAED